MRNFVKWFLFKLNLVKCLSNEEPDILQLIEFSPNPSIVKLAGIHLKPEHLSTLERLETLTVLDLGNVTFEEHRWDARGHCFRYLESLYLSDTNLTFWEAGSNSFPQLRKLVLKNCKQLQRVPDELLMGLDELHIEGVTDYAVKCAKDVEKLILQTRRFNLRITTGESDHHYSYPNQMRTP